MKNGAERQGLWFTAERWNQRKSAFAELKQTYTGIKKPLCRAAERFFPGQGNLSDLFKRR